jgi:hypothetical protein
MLLIQGAYIMNAEVIKPLETNQKKGQAASGILVLPFPKQIETSEKMVALSGKVCIVNHAAGEVAEYAAKRLSRELADIVGLDAKVVTKADTDASLVIDLSIEQFKPEGYLIRSEESGGSLIYAIKGNDQNGILYGTFTILQVIRSVSATAGKPVTPAKLNIEDWPTMTTRLLPTEIYRFAEKDPQAMEKIGKLDWNSTWRFNGFWISLSGSPSRSIAPATEDELSRIATLAKQRGMTLYGILSFATAIEGRGIDDGICPCNMETLAYMKNFFETAAKAGCRGLSIQFDDLTPEIENHHKRCPMCKSRFKSMAEWQLVFIRQMMDVAKTQGIEKLIVCPSPYGRDTADMPRYRDYFKILCAPDFMKDVLIFHCEILPEKVAHLKELGLKNYIWYDNGLWPSPMYYEGNYMGITKLHHIWYGHQPTPEDAVAPAPGILNALGNLGDFCNHIYPSPTGSHVSRAMGGCLAWDPGKTVDNQSVMRKTLVEFLFGRGTWENYKIWEDNMTSWFAAFRNNGLQMDAVRTTLQLNTAEKALDKLVAINKNAKGLSAPLPFLKMESSQDLKQMRETIAKARESLKAPSIPPPLDHIMELPVPEGVQLNIGFDAFSGDRFFDSAVKERFGIFRGGSPILKRGVINNAAFFNGKDNYFSIPANATENLNPGKSSFSVECWVFMMGQWWNSFVDKRGCTRYIYRKPGWALGSDRQGNTWRFTLEDIAEKNITLSFTSDDMLYQWHHLAAVRDTATKMVYFYVDGTLRAKEADPTGDVTNNMPLTCGKDFMVGGGYWGLLDNVTYWKRALSREEVKEHATVKIQKD